MARYILKRIGLALITLVLLSMIVFATAQLLPGNVGRSVLGRDASDQAVAEYNHEHGTDRPAVVQYADWATGVLHGDLGTSLVPPEQPVWDVLRPALLNSLKLAVFAFLLVVPFGILGGVFAGLRVGRPTDRTITVVGLSLAVVPEFVTGLVLILVFAIWLGWLPVTAQWDPARARSPRSSTWRCPRWRSRLSSSATSRGSRAQGSSRLSTPTTHGRRTSRASRTRR